MRAPKMPIADVQVLGQVCWSCDNVSYCNSDPGYSEYTPGNDFSLSCRKGYWEFDSGNDSQHEFARKLKSAETCADFVLHRSIVPAVVLLFALLLPSLAQAQSVSSQLEKPLLSKALIAILVGGAADAISTEVALQRPGIYEANPIMGQHIAQRLAVKSATTLATIWLVKKLEPHHPRAATIMGYAIGGVTSAIAVRNFQNGR